MKGKAKKKRKIGKVILIGMSFFLTILLTFTTTLAWFYDSDWASKYITMGGTVGIRIIDDDGITTSGSNHLHFNINTEKAYPGQAVDVSASCYNDGGRSGTGGSECYVRARFSVFTNIGMTPDPNDYKYGGYDDNPEENPDYIEAVAQAENDQKLTAQTLYAFLDSLIDSQNNLQESTGYRWVFYRKAGGLTLTDSGTATGTKKYYLDGDVSDTAISDTETDRGYFYLCNKNSNVMKPLPVSQTSEPDPDDDSTAVFLWNSTFTIPWQLTNASADKIIFISITFQAIQTYIPIIDGTNGTISSTFVKQEDGTYTGNQKDPSLCTYDDISIQTVFNTCSFTEPTLPTTINGVEVNLTDTSKFSSYSGENKTNPTTGD